jgi:hypothetical protein
MRPVFIIAMVLSLFMAPFALAAEIEEKIYVDLSNSSNLLAFMLALGYLPFENTPNAIRLNKVIYKAALNHRHLFRQYLWNYINSLTEKISSLRKTIIDVSKSKSDSSTSKQKEAIDEEIKTLKNECIQVDKSLWHLLRKIFMNPSGIQLILQNKYPWMDNQRPEVDECLEASESSFLGWLFTYIHNEVPLPYAMHETMSECVENGQVGQNPQGQAQLTKEELQDNHLKACLETLTDPSVKFSHGHFLDLRDPERAVRTAKLVAMWQRQHYENGTDGKTLNDNSPLNPLVNPEFEIKF